MISKIFSNYLTFILPPPSPALQVWRFQSPYDPLCALLECLESQSFIGLTNRPPAWDLARPRTKLQMTPSFIARGREEGVFTLLKHQTPPVRPRPAQTLQLENIKTKTFPRLASALNQTTGTDFSLRSPHYCSLIRPTNMCGSLLGLVQPSFYLLLFEPLIRRYY